MRNLTLSFSLGFAVQANSIVIHGCGGGEPEINSIYIVEEKIEKDISYVDNHVLHKENLSIAYFIKNEEKKDSLFFFKNSENQ